MWDNKTHTKNKTRMETRLEFYKKWTHQNANIVANYGQLEQKIRAIYVQATGMRFFRATLGVTRMES
jgi:hypothetical protein